MGGLALFMAFGDHPTRFDGQCRLKPARLGDADVIAKNS